MTRVHCNLSQANKSLVRSRYALLRQSLLALSVASTALFSVTSANAATKTWTGATNSDFNTAGNWTGGVPGTADNGVFQIAVASPVTLSANASILGLQFDTNTTSFTLGAVGGNTITGATGGAITVTAGLTGSGKTFTVNAPIIMGGTTYNFTNNNATASNALVFGGQVSSATGTSTLSLGGTNTGANTFGGNLVNGSGTAGLIKTGAGAWNLTSTGNSYTGATLVTGGTLNLSGSITGTSGVTVNGTGILNQTSTGVISGSGGVLINAATAVVTLGGTNTYTGATTLSNGGTLNLASAGAIGATSGLLLNTGTLDNTSGGALTLSNNPAITFGANPTTLTFAGTNDLNLGTGAVGMVAGLIINVNNGKTLTTGAWTNTQTTGGNPGFTSTQVNGTGTLVIGGFTLASPTFTGNTQIGGNANVVINGAITTPALGQPLFTYNGTGSLTINGTMTNVQTFTVSSGSGILNGSIAGAVVRTQGGTFTESSTGTLTGAASVLVSGGSGTFLGSNTSTGAVSVSGGSLTIAGASGAFGSTTSVVASGGTLTIDNTTAAGGNNTNRINNAASLTLSGGSVLYKGSDAVATNSTETIGNIGQGAGSSSFTLTFGGTNTVTITGAQFTHSAGNGGTLVNGLNLGADSTSTASISRLITTTAPGLVGTTAALSTGINSAKKDTQVVAFLTGEASLVTGGLGTATGNSNTFVTYNATTGYRPLNPVDEFTNNTITAGNNTYITTGTTSTTSAAINSLVLNGGNLSIDNGTTLTNNSGALLFAANGTIQPSGTTGAYSVAGTNREHMITVNNGVTGTISSVIAINGANVNALTKSGKGSLVLSAANTYSGITTVAGGILSAQNNAALGTLGNGTVVATGATLQLQGGVTIGAEGLTISGAGATGTTGVLQNVSGNNTYGGAIAQSVASTISSDAGTLTLSGNVSGAFTLTLAGAGNGVTNGVIGIAAGPVTKAGTGTWALAGANTYTGTTTVSAGTLQLGNGGTTGSLATTSAIVDNATFAVNRSNTVTQGTDFSGAAITGTGGFTQAGTGTTFLTAANSFSGATTINSGILNAATLANTNVNSSIGKGSAGGSAADLVLNGGTLQYTGTSAASTSRSFTVTTNGGALDASGTGSGSVTYSGAATASGSTGGQTLTLTGTGSGSSAGTINGDISNGSGSNVTSVTKSGTGTWNLGGINNTYTGTTTITGGTLVLTDFVNNIGSSNKIIVGDTAAHSSAVLDVSGMFGAFAVANGQTLAGHGTVSGDATMGTGSILSPGNSAGTLSFNSNLTLNNAAAGSLVFDLGTASDRVNVAGLLTLNSQDITSFTFDTSGGGFGAGTYVLFDATGLSGALGSNLTTTISGFNATLSLDNTNSDIILTVAVVPEPGTWAMMIGGLVVLIGIQRRRSKTS